MSRIAYSITACLAMASSALDALAESPVAAESAAIGEMVDADMPATYRLPPVDAATAADAAASSSPIFGAPIEAAANDAAEVSREISLTPVPAQAGCPPDDGLEAAGGGGTAGQMIVAFAKPQAMHREEEFAKLPFDNVQGRQAERVVAAELTAQMLPAVQRGFGLAQRGALYAARTEFVQVLRRVAQAHDVASDSNVHSRALAAGLRALDEAEDFVPDGVQLEAELDLRTVASSHRTLVLPEEPEEVSAFEAAGMYHSFAREKLKEAVAGEQAGSMALYGLGTVYARLAERKDDDVQFTRSAMTMYSAALEACPDNHLAANELGVLVCRAGRAEEAAALFEQTINFAPSAVAYHNLAVAQHRFGLYGQAAANEAESQRLAALERSRGEVSRRAGVRWVSPREMARASQPVNRMLPERVARPVGTGTKGTWR
jgi:tetratricopeptide (TPR) repeat protein